MGAQQILLNPTLIAGASTWANIPAASAYPAGTQWRVTDIGSAGSIWVTNATRWYPLNGSVAMFSTVFPMILPSSGTIGNNGALSGLTALHGTYDSCYMYFPENAIAAGVAAGLYYCAMSSTTAGTIYNNTYTSGAPTIPASPTAFSTTGPGAYTQTTGSFITVLSVTVPGNSMGINGGLDSQVALSNNNSAGVKTFQIKLGAYTMLWASNTTALLFGSLQPFIKNMGVANRQNGNVWGAAPGTIDTTTDQTLVVAGMLEVATDFFYLQGINFRLTGS